MYKHKTLGRKDMVLFTVSAILLLDTVAASASIGVASLFWWVAAGLIFFLPFGLVCAEMGCAYPEQGGIYAWVRNPLAAAGSRGPELLVNNAPDFRRPYSIAESSSVVLPGFPVWQSRHRITLT